MTQHLSADCDRQRKETPAVAGIETWMPPGPRSRLIFSFTPISACCQWWFAGSTCECVPWSVLLYAPYIADTHAALARPADSVLPPPSQVVRVGLVAKKGLVQGVSRPGTGGSTCSSSNASNASLVMLLRGAPAYPATAAALLSWQNAILMEILLGVMQAR